MLNRIRGPLVIDGEGGQGSLAGLSNPVLMPGEIDERPKDGDVISNAGTEVTVAEADLPAHVMIGNVVDNLVGRTLTLAEEGHEFEGEFRLITGAVISGGEVTLTVNEAFSLTDLSDLGFAITDNSLNFFVNEADQLDWLTAINEDSIRNELVVLTATRITGFGMVPDVRIAGRLQPGGITYANMEHLELRLAAGSDSLTIQNTHFGTTTVESMGGDDVIHVDATSGHTTLNTGLGSDTVTIGNRDATLGTVDLADYIQGLLTINGDPLIADVSTFTDGIASDQTNEVQYVTLNAESGTFSLTLGSETTALLSYPSAESAFEIADELQEGPHYRQRTDRREVEITPQGKTRLAEIGEVWGGIWRSRIRREESVRQALAARLLFYRGDQYIVRDGKVQIVDEYSGWVMEDRSWNEGMHQLIEVKEGVAVTGRKAPSIRTSYQRFFRRYRRLAGMTGTAREVASELRAVYRLKVARVEPNRPSRRRDLPTRYLASLAEKRQAIARRAAEISAAGRPVLIGTRSIAASLELSAVLDAAGVSHQVLNAESEAEEAAIIATAGGAGRVTVATNMAGRGVDIALGSGVEAAGGLHVILSERHDARRIDRQLAGRAGRQGDAGSFEAILSRDDPLLQMIQAGPGLAGKLRTTALRLLPALAFTRAQRKAEKTHSRIRKDLLNMDDQTGTMLAFAGDTE